MTLGDYPFGLKHKGYNNVTSSNGNSTAQKFGFGGMELQDELGLVWYDITARNYDPTIGRWMNIDPLAEKMRRHSIDHLKIFLEMHKIILIFLRILSLLEILLQV